VVRPLSFALAVASGCGSGWTEETADGLRHLSQDFTSTSSGTVRFDVPVEEGEDALLLTARVDSPLRTHVRSFADPDDALLFEATEFNDSPYSKTNAGFIAETVTLNWPILGEDSDLVDGRYTVELGIVDEDKQFAEGSVSVDVFLKSDTAFDDGALDVAIVYTADLDDDDDIREAVEDAKVIWADLYDSMGIEVAFEGFTVDAAELHPPALGTETAYIAIDETTPLRAVNLVLSPEILDFPSVFGIAGDIPGPLVATERSAVQISTSLASGVDGRFTEEEVRLFSETMAHEVGHYLGLFHPVELSYDAWDVIDDTPECDSQGQCENQLGDNLMFPYPICSVFSCTAQTEITDHQAEVAGRYTAVE